IGLTVNEGATGTISKSRLEARDTDTDNATLIFTVTTLPNRGVLKVDGTTLATNGTFTQADIDANKITYEHDDSNTTSDGFQFTVSDGTNTTGTLSFNISVTPVDDDVPTVTVNAGLTLAEGATATIGNTQLAANDTDSANASLNFT